MSRVSPDQAQWVRRVEEETPAFLERLRDPEREGRYSPVVQGATPAGDRVALGFSCFALKIHHTLGRWEGLGPARQAAWLDFIRSFQVAGDPTQPTSRDAFWDPAVMDDLLAQERRPLARLRRLWKREALSAVQRTIIAETKQAIASLAEVGAAPARPYLAFPQTPEGVRQWLERLPWRLPWGAGAQSCQLAAFLRTQAPAVLPAARVEGLLAAATAFLDSIVDPQSGAYFRGQAAPERGQLINGAMKVLTALDWLEAPIHHPRRLIDTCLRDLPAPEGCHLVDIVYVLYRCLRQTDHRRDEAQTFSLALLEMIRRHHNPDGGFSYYIGRSQVNYYGVDIARGLAESDIHGAILLVWALAMLLEILEQPRPGWRVIKP